MTIHHRITSLLIGPRWQHVLGILLLVSWLIWWNVSLSQPCPRLIGGQYTYLDRWAWPYIGLDFLHEYSGGSTLAAGNNPYKLMSGNPMFDQYTYPPIILPFFTWCHFFPFEGIIDANLNGIRFLQPYSRSAVFIWTATLVVIFSYATYLAWRERVKLGYGPIALPLALGLMLLGFPVIFAMERGNCDALMLLFILFGVLALRRKTWWWDLVTGLCFAIAAWMKLYPAFLILALLFLRRWRPAIFSLAGIGVIGFATYPWVIQWVDIVKDRLYQTLRAGVHAHSLSGAWHYIWSSWSVPSVAAIPGAIGAGVVVLSIAAAVGWFVYRSERREELTLPYILWMSALATYWPLISFDYNLFYLPLAILIVWRRRDPLWIHISLACYLVWYQPWLIWQAPIVATLAKLVGVFVVGMSLVNKLLAPSASPTAPLQDITWNYHVPTKTNESAAHA